MRMCPTCHENFAEGERLQANVPKTFTFKPADIADAKIIRETKHGQKIEVSPAAVLSPDALAESRADHRKTVIATMFFTYGKMEIPEDAANVRHVACAIRRTGERVNGTHPGNKHEMRYRRSILRKQ